MAPIVKNETSYQSGDLLAVAYPAEHHLAAAYLRFRHEGLLSFFFHEWAEDPTVTEFIGMCRPPYLTMGVFRKSLDVDVMELVGLGRISEPRAMGGGLFKCEVGEMFFREYQRRDITTMACSLMLEYVFDRTCVDVIFGTTPEPNRAALRFMKAMGYEHIESPIPYYTTWKGEPCGAYVSWLTKERWQAVRPFGEK